MTVRLSVVTEYRSLTLATTGKASILRQDLILNDHQLVNVQTYKHLGLLLSSDLSWTQVRNYFGTKAKKSKRAEDWEHFKKLRNHVTWCQRRAKRHYFEDLSMQSPGKKEMNRLLGTRYR